MLRAGYPTLLPICRKGEVGFSQCSDQQLLDEFSLKWGPNENKFRIFISVWKSSYTCLSLSYLLSPLPGAAGICKEMLYNMQQDNSIILNNIVYCQEIIAIKKSTYLPLISCLLILSFLFASESRNVGKFQKNKIHLIER